MRLNTIIQLSGISLLLHYSIVSSSTAAEAISTMFHDRRRFNLRTINGVGFDNSTTPPKHLPPDAVRSIVFAKPSDSHWTMVTPDEASYPEYDPSYSGKILFHSLISKRGCCYVATPWSSSRCLA
uniref:Uncharacterized protein n=1 Tax=Oryza punctata TaxID=4537 RepID=A0A0E0MK24_ORYPU